MPMRQLEQIAQFTGGVPGLVNAVARSVQSDPSLRIEDGALLERLGPVADEVRSTLDIITAHDGFCDRLQQLSSGSAMYEREDVDKPLIMAGLVRRLRVHGESQVTLRAPAFGELIAER
jgi:hypothetical protein